MLIIGRFIVGKYKINLLKFFFLIYLKNKIKNFLKGFAVGVAAMVVPIYLAEVSYYFKLITK